MATNTMARRDILKQRKATNPLLRAATILSSPTESRKWLLLKNLAIMKPAWARHTELIPDDAIKRYSMVAKKENQLQVRYRRIVTAFVREYAAGSRGIKMGKRWRNEKMANIANPNPKMKRKSRLSTVTYADEIVNVDEAEEARLRAAQEEIIEEEENKF